MEYYNGHAYRTSLYKCEAIIGDFMDMNFWNKFRGFSRVPNWEGTYNDEQEKGVDLYVDGSTVDEKAKMFDIGRENMSTDFALQVMINKDRDTTREENKKGERMGWLLRHTDTNYYAFLYPKAKEYITSYTQLQSPDDLNFVDVIIVPKDALYNKLHECGLDGITLLNESVKITRDAIRNHKTTFKNLNNDYGMRMMCNPNNDQQQVNLLVSQEFLNSIAYKSERIFPKI